jgi:hypothetical protein
MGLSTELGVVMGSVDGMEDCDGEEGKGWELEVGKVSGSIMMGGEIVDCSLVEVYDH